jgi:RNA polymerase sigma factor (TIGR02999 family)
MVAAPSRVDRTRWPSTPGAVPSAERMSAKKPESTSRPAWDPPGGAADPATRAEFDAVFAGAYQELRRLAAAVRRSDPHASLSPTTLVGEAWLKLSRTPDLARTGHAHFKRVAGRAMRQVLVEAARRRGASKRGGRDLERVTLDEDLAGPSAGEDVLALDAALRSLAKLSPRQADLVEGRFFGGLEAAEAAALLGVSESTVERDWRAARAWLARELRRAG